MSALIRKLNKAAVGLHPGEQIVAAMVLHPNGTARKVAMGRVLGNVMERRARTGDGELVDDRGLAAQMPDGPAVMALTTTRVVVYTQSGMAVRPTDVSLDLQPDDIVTIEVGKDRIGPAVRLGFADGTERMYETPMKNKDVANFVELVTKN